MKRSILITGIAGSGKSTVSKRLRELGYATHDIETIEGLFESVVTATGEPVAQYDNKNFDQVKDTSWICNVEKLRGIIRDEPSELAFYCGISTNIGDIAPLFDAVFVLTANAKNTRHRLSTRTSHDFGKTKEVQDWLISWKDNWDKYMTDRGAVLIDANGPVDEVVRTILKRVQNK